MTKKFLKALAWFGAYFAIQNAVSIVLAVATIFMTPGLLESMTNPETAVDAVTQAINSIVIPTLIISSILLIIIYLVHCKIIKRSLDIKRFDWQKALFFTGAAAVLNTVCNVGLSLLANVLPESWVSQLEDSTSLVSTGQPVWMLFLCTAILVPIMEEIIFRYGIHRTLAQKNLIVAYIVSTCVFGVVHGNPLQIFMTMIIGFLLAFVYTKTDNIWYPIIMHMVNNAASLSVQYFPSTAMYLYVVAGGGAILALITLYTCPRVKTMVHKNKINIEPNTQI